MKNHNPYHVPFDIQMRARRPSLRMSARAELSPCPSFKPPLSPLSPLSLVHLWVDSFSCDSSGLETFVWWQTLIYNLFFWGVTCARVSDHGPLDRDLSHNQLRSIGHGLDRILVNLRHLWVTPTIVCNISTWHAPGSTDRISIALLLI